MEEPPLGELEDLLAGELTEIETAAAETQKEAETETAAETEKEAETQKPAEENKKKDEEGKLVGQFSDGAMVMATKLRSSVPDLETPTSCTQAVCRHCKTPVDPLKKGVRLMRKTPAEWQCSRCCSKTVTLSSIFGSWPISAYHELSDIQKEAFWKESGDGKVALTQAVEKRIVMNQIKQIIDENVGKFLPAAVWVAKGWRLEDVLKCPCEIHKQTGVKTYQVAVHSTGTKTIQELVRTEMEKLLDPSKISEAKAKSGRCGALRKKPFSASSAAAAAPPVEAGGEVAAAEEESDQGTIETCHSKSPSLKSGRSGRSGRSSARSKSRRRRSDSRKRRRSRSESRKRRRSRSESRKSRRSRSRKSRRSHSRKSRRSHSRKSRRSRSKSRSRRSRSRRSSTANPLEAKLKQKLEQEEQKRQAAAEKKRCLALSSEATKVVGKVSPIIANLEKITIHKSFKLVPTRMQKSIEESLKTLTKYQDDAKSRISGNTLAFTFTIEDVSRDSKAGTREVKSTRGKLVAFDVEIC